MFVTGSAGGIGHAAAQSMVAAGHEVLLHARTADRPAVPGALGVVVGDLESIQQTRALATAADRFGPFDAIIHNAGVYESGTAKRPTTVDGLERTFAVNVVAPYLLTTLMALPARLVYLTSGLHESGRPDFDDLQWERRPYRWMQAYADSKLAVVALAFAVAADHSEVLSNAVDPGWVRSRMGGPGAPVSLAEGAATPVRLATDPTVRVSGRYFTGGRERPAHRQAGDPTFQRAVLAACARLTDTSR